MKLNRLLEITTILLNKKTITAAELASRFSVSTRTIYRDIDVLSASGVPVYSTQGTNGGISIIEDYTVNRAALSNSERESVLLALQSLKATKYPEIDTALEKLGGIFKQPASDWISVDFSPWGSNPNAYGKFTDIKYALLQSRVIELDYINGWNEKSRRRIQPLRLLFKSQSWYLWGFCLLKQDYRTFRISRIKQVVLTDETFDRDRVKKQVTPVARQQPQPRYLDLILEFTMQALHRLYDDYDEDMIVQLESGRYRIEVSFPEDDWVYGYILSFGSAVEVIKPDYMREIIKEKAREIAKHYE